MQGKNHAKDQYWKQCYSGAIRLVMSLLSHLSANRNIDYNNYVVYKR